MLRSLLLALMMVPVSLPAAVHEFRLTNGMKVVVKEDHRAPVVVSQVWYKVGSTYEHDGITGVSHALEHMMFKGTPKYPAGEFSRIIAELGGRENAFTARDYTAYFQQLHKDRLAVALELEADRMRNLQLLPEEFDKERQVVIEERRLRTEDNPQSLTFETFTATAFQASPNRFPIIGWMNDLETMRIEDLKDWYRRWYAPNNATLVVVGDVDPQRVLALARQHFGPVAPSDLEAPKARREPEQRGVRRVTVKAPGKLPFVVFGYKTPNLKEAEKEWEPYALEVLAGLLDGGASSRLSKNLVRGQQIATSAGAGYGLYSRLPGLFTFSAVPANGHSLEKVEAALRREIEKVRTEPVSDRELQRVKTGVVASAVYEQDSLFYQAMQIGVTETVGLGHKVLDEYVRRVQSITAEQVRQVADKYLHEDRLTIAVLEPQPLEGGVRPRGSVGGRHGG